MNRLPKGIKIAAIVVLAVVDLALIGLDIDMNEAACAAAAGKFPSYWWLTIIAACLMVGVPAAVVLVFWRRMKDASSGRWNADNILWSCLGSLVVGIVGFVLALILLFILWMTALNTF
jgi:heme/copper-type cytochrome/quinol oxidase subunit 4